MVAALQTLGGIGNIKEITKRCEELGFRHPAHSIRARLQENSSDAVWKKAIKPANARDLFYTFDPQKRTGIWGLRGFSAAAPYAYPISELAREHSILLQRSDTPLPRTDPHGIVISRRTVRALQISFAPESNYPDRLLTDGKIEHIGEGKGQVQKDTRGNRAMIEAIEKRSSIPVFQSIGKRGAGRRYVRLGLYRPTGYERRSLRLPGNGFDTSAFVFFLEPLEIELPIIETPPEFSPAQHTFVEDVPVEAYATSRMMVSARAEIAALRREAPLFMLPTPAAMLHRCALSQAQTPNCMLLMELLSTKMVTFMSPIQT